MTVRASPMAGLVRAIGPEWLRTYAIACGMAVLLCFTGANDTASLPVSMRFLFWISLMLGGTLIAQIVSILLDRWMRLNAWQEVLVTTVAITPPITLLVWLVSAAFVGRAPEVRNLTYYLPPVVLISLCMATLHAAVNRQPLQSHVLHPDKRMITPGGEFRDRLPFKFRQAEIYALSAEDHYLRVHSAAGETLILMRLYDAIRELDGIEGSQIHRSWWVAKEAVTDVTRKSGRIDLVLKGGQRAPVSRRYQKALKTGGWL